jgi:threonyl-tRNA synthetase
LPDQVTEEILGVLNLTEQILSDFGFWLTDKTSELAAKQGV